MGRFVFIQLIDFLMTFNIELPRLNEEHTVITDPYLSSNTALNLLRLTLSLSFCQVAQTALWTSGTRSTRSACVSSTDTRPASPHWPSTTMAPCSQSPPPTCTRRETSATQRTPSSSAKSQTPRPSPSESPSPLAASVWQFATHWIYEQLHLQGARPAAAYADLYLCLSAFQYPTVER